MESAPGQTDKITPEKALLFRLANRQIVELRGKDSQDYLQRISTADFRSLALGNARQTLFLGRDGRMQAECIALYRAADRFDLITPSPCVKNLLDVLDLYHFGEDISFIVNPKCTAYMLMGSLDTSVEVPDAAVFGAGEWGAVPVTYIVSETELRPDVFHARLGTDDQLLVLRIANMIAEADFEIVPGKTIPLEVNQKSSISFTKGCYPGQEIIARIYNLGHPANIMVRLQLESEISPGHANLYSSDGKSAGVITSAVRVTGSNQYDCLAIVKWIHREKGTILHARDLQGNPKAVIVQSAAAEPGK